MKINFLLLLSLAVSINGFLLFPDTCPALSSAVNLSEDSGGECIAKPLQLFGMLISLIPTSISGIICSVNNMINWPQTCADDMKFYIYSPGNRYIEASMPTMYNLHQNFIPKDSRVVIYMHGWTNKCDEMCSNTIKMATIESVFICIQWQSCGGKDYISSANTIPQASEAASRFIYDIIMKKFQIPISNILLIGHSLGCHLAGRTGRFLQSMYNQRLDNIVGIDCAGPLFKNDPNARIRCTDAKNVISFMCSYVLGPGSHILGTHNYIVNNGGNQPACAHTESCLDEVASKGCSHSFCCNIVADLLATNTKQYLVSRCKCFNQCLEPEPKSCPVSLTPSPDCAPGLFSVYTNPFPPYAMGELGAKGCAGCKQCYNCFGKLTALLSYSGDGKYCYEGCKGR